MKHSIMKLYKFFSFVLLGLVIGSCSDDYLDFQPIASQNSSSFYLTQAQAEQAVTAAYAILASRTGFDRDISLYMSDVASDDCEAGGDFENEVQDAEVFNRFTMLPSNVHLDDSYGLLFRGVYYCNVALEKIPYVLEVDDEASPAIINRRVAELKFLRALYYLYLTHIFGEVPLVDHVLTGDEYEQPRASFRELFDLMENDLLEAIPVLPEKGALSAADAGRATKGAAKALLARVYLFESSYAHYSNNDSRFANLTEKWADVLDYSKQVIESDQYDLLGIKGETYSTWHGPNTDGFRYIFTTEGENAGESVFEIQFIRDNLAYTYTRGGSLIQWVSPRYYDDNSGTQQETNYWGLGWPTESLADAYDEGDPRFKTTMSSQGDSIEVTGGDRYLINFDNTATGYYQNKYVLAASEFLDNSTHRWHKSPYNFKLIRYADVVLMAAEAEFMLNHNAEAMDYVNMIRTRARMCGGAANTVPANLDAITFQNIVDERRRELACEGRRFYDLVRWNLATEYLGGYVTPGGFATQFQSPKNDFMPLPALEVAVSQGALVQYPGW